MGERCGAHDGAAGQICESRTKFVRANKMNSGNAHKRNRKHKHKFVFVFAMHKINSGCAPHTYIQWDLDIQI
jgi:hypothetical protein